MYLHEKQEDFRELLRLTADWASLPRSFVVKDYFAVTMLKEVTRRNPAIVFKGERASQSAMALSVAFPKMWISVYRKNTQRKACAVV